MPKKIHLDDPRKVSAASGKAINSARTGDYDYEVVANIVKAAKEEGVDPYDALAVGLQESGLGKAHSNVGQVEFNRLQSDPKRYAGYQQAVSGSKDDMYTSARGLAYMLRTSKDVADRAGYRGPAATDEQRLQAYNGYGKVGKDNDIGAKELYGVDLTSNTIDMAKTPLYGRTIVDLRDNVLKKNPEIKEIVENHDLSPEELKDVSVVIEPTSAGKVKYSFRKSGQPLGEAETDDPQLKTQAAKGAFTKTMYRQAIAAAQSGLAQHTPPPILSRVQQVINK